MMYVFCTISLHTCIHYICIHYTGSDKEPEEDEAETALAGQRARITAEEHYNR